MKSNKVVFSLCLFLYSLPSLSFANFSKEQLDKFTKAVKFGLNPQISDVINMIKLNSAPTDIPSVTPIIQKILDENTDSEILKNTFYLIGVKEITALSPSLITLLQTMKDDDAKEQLIRTLGKLKAVPSQDDLMRIYSDNNTPMPIKKACIFALSEMKDTRLVPLLNDLLNKSTDDKDLGERIIEALGKLKDDSSIDALNIYFNNTNNSDFDRAIVPKAIGAIGSPKAQEWLKAHLEEKNTRIKLGVLEGYSLIPHADFSAVSKDIIASLKDDDKDVRISALKLLPFINYPDKVEFLKYALDNDPDQEVKTQIATSLIVNNKTDALAYFKTLLVKATDSLKIAILNALDAQKDQESLFTTFYPDIYFSIDNKNLRQAILSFSGTHIAIKSSYQFLKTLLENPNIKGNKEDIAKDKIASLNALTQNNYDDMFPKLTEIINNPNDPLFDNAINMIGINQKGVDFLVNLINHMDYQKYNGIKRSYIYQQINYLRPKNAKEALIKNYREDTDPQVHIQLKQLLIYYGVSSSNTYTY